MFEEYPSPLGHTNWIPLLPLLLLFVLFSFIGEFYLPGGFWRESVRNVTWPDAGESGAGGLKAARQLPVSYLPSLSSPHSRQGCCCDGCESLILHSIFQSWVQPWGAPCSYPLPHSVSHPVSLVCLSLILVNDHGAAQSISE